MVARLAKAVTLDFQRERERERGGGGGEGGRGRGNKRWKEIREGVWRQKRHSVLVTVRLFLYVHPTL